MYHEKSDTYSCDICGFEMGWEDHDDEHGELWGCELCGATFCTKCYVERHGRKNTTRWCRVVVTFSARTTRASSASRKKP